MSLLAKHPYIKIERTVTSTKQMDVEDHRWIKLYTDRIETKHRTFPIQDVMDLSYRKLINQSGLLYVHTKQGVFSYITKLDPQAFIRTYKEFCQKNDSSK